MSPQEFLAKLNYEKILQQIWDDVDSHSSYGIYSSTYTLPDNAYLAEQLFEAFNAHSQIKSAELKTSDEGFYTLELSYPEKDRAKRKSRTVKKKG